MRKRSAWSSIISLAAASALLLAACGGGGSQSAGPAAGNGNAASPASAPSADVKEKVKGQTLNLLTWEGYADPLFTKGFEELYGVKVNPTYFGSSDELLAKLKAGGGSTYDIISPSSDVAQLLVQSDMVEPIDPAKISSFQDLNEKLRNLTDVQKDGKLYGLPFTWGPDYLIYDGDVIKEEPTSWNIFWDPRYKGKVSLWDDINNLYMMGQIMGLDKSDPAALYNMTEEQLQQAKQKLVELKPNVRKYWATAGELNDLFANKEVVLAVGWPLTVKEVNAKGRNLKWTIPQEGATGWIDRLMIVKGTQHRELADLYLDYIASPKAMALVAEVTTYSVANPKAAAHMTKELQEMTYVNDMDKMFTRLNFWQYVKDRARYNEVWTEVKTN
ncbi:ABC transporter substrate-binding protein [Brevibacillus sp. SYP-B805]|uniref:ABC transporter substrate-binding protein n=1 Tax=Brevibacillus sp. SYP-B805 TaxID=1578199 RepID=UPI0013EB5ED4|nr:ABC transporter substrate-binding protein [Brevibacillus sp. SYP-B805]NGQ96771.1 ABC transporter substrate-binding protein [Brevibacillus sp. SYP-B805]